MDNLETQHSGLGNNAQKGAAPLVNKDGTSNVKHINRTFKIDDLYSYLIEISWSKFFLFVFLGYIVLNTIFGIIYLLIGIHEITPSTGNLFYDFLNGFFFSAQTITTVGYGGISPSGMLGNIVSTFEALIGLLCFSFITGLLYGRFSKPRAAIQFSEKILIRKFNGNRALMFRLMNKRNNVMIQAQINVVLTINKKDEKNLNVLQYNREIYDLQLERNHVIYLPTMWTVVHEINQTSPLYQYQDEELKNLDAEIYILASYHEESFSQKVYQVYTYNFSEIIFNCKFVPSYKFDAQGNTLLDHNDLNKTEPVS